jgi:hypothetical protein
MKRVGAVALLLILGLQVVEPAFAARRVVVRHRGPRRTVVVVHRGWPLRRPARTVVVHPVRTVVRVTPGHYLAPVVFGGVLVATAPAQDLLVWQDSEMLNKGDDWTEFTLNADARGTRLWLSVQTGRIQFDWAEVVFENGDARVVDFKEGAYGEGMYPLLDFADGRKVDHVRMVARARSEDAKVALMMEK